MGRTELTDYKLQILFCKPQTMPCDIAFAFTENTYGLDIAGFTVCTLLHLQSHRGGESPPEEGRDFICRLATYSLLVA